MYYSKQESRVQILSFFFLSFFSSRTDSKPSNVDCGGVRRWAWVQVFRRAPRQVDRMYDGGLLTVTGLNSARARNTSYKFSTVTVRCSPSYIRSTCFGARRNTWTHAHRRTLPQSTFERFVLHSIEKIATPGANSIGGWTCYSSLCEGAG